MGLRGFLGLQSHNPERPLQLLETTPVIFTNHAENIRN